MNETEIRDRIQAATGDAPYPPALTSRVAARLAEPPRAHAAPRLVSVVAALLAFAIVATLVFIRFQSAPRALVPESSPPPPNPVATPHRPPAPSIIGVSQADLDRTQLPTESNLVTPLNLSSTSNGRKVTLIGAYADHARTVLFFRSMPTAGFPHANIYDGRGFLNAASNAGAGSIGDTYFVLDAGPHAGSDGLAHLKVVVDAFDSLPNQRLRGSWTFAFALTVGAFTRLALEPPLTAVGTWQVTLEAMEETPTSIHFQAVINGAAVEDIKPDTVTLTDTSGHPIETLTEDAATTVPKSQLGSTPPRSTRVNITWNRPSAVSTDTLTIVGGGGAYHGYFVATAPGSVDPKQGAPSPTIYPTAHQALTINGAFSTAITSARPTACGSGTGPSGTIFAFGALFQVAQDWYSISASTDPAVRRYSGRGTYLVEAEIYPAGASAIFEGPVELTVTSDHWPGPMTGTLRGTMAWTGEDSSSSTITVGGSWTCNWSNELGPA